jgi:putative N6-adenine-specific DNA methylase
MLTKTAGTLYTACAFCAVGAEKALTNELHKLGLLRPSGDAPRAGRVRFLADIAGLYRALLNLRTADRVLLELARFPAPDFDALFEGTRSAPWEGIVPPSFGLTVAKVRVSNSTLASQAAVQAVVNKAAAERLFAKYNTRQLPDGPAVTKAEARVFLDKNEASILLDLSGEPLFKRGYRKIGGDAPLRETSAAALILLSNWRRKLPLYDPFCGSGTIAIEAALFAWDAAPGLARRFGISRLGLADQAVEKAAREEAAAKVNFEHRIRICGSDSDEAAVKLAQDNLKNALKLTGLAPAGVQPAFEVCQMARAKPPAAWGADVGLLVTNPPWGERLGSPAQSEALYREMAVLRRNFPGWQFAVISDHPGFETFFGKKANRCLPLTNGPIQTYIYEYM